MAAAVVQAQCGTGASVTWANAEGGVKFSRDDSINAGTTPVPIPTATGTNYSWIKNLVLAVTTVGTTNMSNRRVSLSATPTTGLTLDFKGVAVASYAQAATGNMPAAAGTNGAVPATYTGATTSLQVYDATSVATSSTGPNGQMCVMVMGVDNTYVGGAGSAVSLPNVVLTYDEA